MLSTQVYKIFFQTLFCSHVNSLDQLLQSINCRNIAYLILECSFSLPSVFGNYVKRGAD